MGFSNTGNLASTEYVEDAINALPQLEPGRRTSVNESVPGALSVELDDDVPFGTPVGTGLPNVKNTTVPTSLLPASNPWAFAGDYFAVGDSSDIFCSGQLLNNSGGAATIQFDLKFGALTAATFTTASLANNAATRPWSLTAQITAGEILPDTVYIFGTALFELGDLATGVPVGQQKIILAGAIDLSNPITVDLTVDPSVASNNLSIDMLAGRFVKVPT